MIFIYSIVVITLLGTVHPQKNVGDSCVDTYTNTPGKCSTLEDCASARHVYEKSAISPTFCNPSFDNPLVCCKDGTNILQKPKSKKIDEEQVLGTGINKKTTSESRPVSERKCEQYSRSVTQTVDFIALVPDPDIYRISAPKCNYQEVELIVGGEDSKLGEFPHMAAIGWINYQDEYEFSCGGSLISPRFVLTAGHCTYDPNQKKPVPSIVRLGDQNIDPTVDDGASPVDVVIANIHKHPDYKPPIKYNDIALLELNLDVDFSNSIRPACLWTKPDFRGYTKGIATGWGHNDTRKVSAKELQKVSLTLLENDHCDYLLYDDRHRNWWGFVDSQLCAGELRGKKDTCQGDSGSPLQVVSEENQCIFHVIGLTSFGKRCATGLPAVYTRVSAFVPWIERIVWPNEQ